ncbi:bifunctional folylpolyglutamate synthase/dihydrofolate synthase [Litorihabitans aurantiacus]|uniref:tetrahydrofolate synthase n=1 Tax=Litorihabitans aurantiacus TaxID=1930061 RepID=A0AA37XEK8_9MICO|nr:hypothetical protein GCM10025875_18400 [Litorihabitans aurantiacus]
MSREGAASRRREDDVALETRVREITAEILRRTPEHDFDPTIERVQRVIDVLGSPQSSFRAIHLTGTNGKTSTARMIDALLRELGLRVGRFTSPHLSTIRERIAIDGEPITREAWVRTWEDVAAQVAIVDGELTASGKYGAKAELSFFEVLTAMAFSAFADAPVDVAVIEVGMGGEWDSTNVVDAEVAVISPVALDHERWLGHTLGEIATVKSGIVKAGATVVSAAQDEEVAAVVAARAERVGARLVTEVPTTEDGEVEVAAPGLAVLARTLAVGGQVVTLRGVGAVYEDVFVPLHGAHQAHNALLAVAAVEAFLGEWRCPATSWRPRSPVSPRRGGSSWCAARPPSWSTPPTTPPARGPARRRSRRRSRSTGSSASSV